MRTTGWLRVEQTNGEVSVRKWLDIGNGPQRREFLAALAARSKWPGIDDLDGKLARLGGYLEGQPAGPVPPSEPAAGWRVLGDNTFAIAFYESPKDILCQAGPWRRKGPPTRRVVWGSPSAGGSGGRGGLGTG